MLKTTFEIIGEPSVEAQEKALSILVKAFGRRHGLELEAVFGDIDSDNSNIDNNHQKLKEAKK